MNTGQVIVFSYQGDDIKVDQVRRTAAYAMAPHMHHDRFELYYLLSGAREYLVRDSIYAVGRGEMILIPAGELHKSLDSRRPEHERIVVEFAGRLIRRELDLIGLPLLEVFRSDQFVLHLSEPLRLRAEKLLFEIMRELREKQAGHLAMVRLCLVQLLLLIHRCPDRRAGQPDPPLQGRQAWITGITRYIHERYADPLTLTALAQRFAVSPCYLSRCFHQETGLHLPDYINLVRVKEAKLRLLEGQEKVTEIALSVGYGSVTHFGRVFRKINGLSPSQLKRSGKERPGVLPADASDQIGQGGPIGRVLARLNPIAELVAEDASEILVPRVGEQAARIGRHADELG